MVEHFIIEALKENPMWFVLERGRVIEDSNGKAISWPVSLRMTCVGLAIAENAYTVTLEFKVEHVEAQYSYYLGLDQAIITLNGFENYWTAIAARADVLARDAPAFSIEERQAEAPDYGTW
jgi:hypothetical protein